MDLQNLQSETISRPNKCPWFALSMASPWRSGSPRPVAGHSPVAPRTRNLRPPGPRMTSPPGGPAHDSRSCGDVCSPPRSWGKSSMDLNMYSIYIYHIICVCVHIYIESVPVWGWEINPQEAQQNRCWGSRRPRKAIISQFQMLPPKRLASWHHLVPRHRDWI